MPLWKTALHRLELELELAQHPGSPQELLTIPCTSPRGHRVGTKATHGHFAGDGVTTLRIWTNSRLFLSVSLNSFVLSFRCAGFCFLSWIPVQPEPDSPRHGVRAAGRCGLNWELIVFQPSLQGKSICSSLGAPGLGSAFSSALSTDRGQHILAASTSHPAPNPP